jgi:serine/threonine protein kinase
MEGTAQQLIGTRLGSAILKQIVGSGGMGMVYLAHQEHLDRDVAVKVLRSGIDVSSDLTAEFLERFRREAHVIAQLDHINILHVYEYGEQGSLAYLIMPYLTGGSLYERLQKSAPLPFHEVMSYIEQAAAALAYAHAHKIIHRDIKPRNMLFHADGRLVLVDFGIAHILRDDIGKATGQTLTGSGHFIGSVDYMAPEMVRGKSVDVRTDIYELGVVLFQMLTGRLPFIGTSPFIVAAQHMHEPVPSLLPLNPDLTPGIDAVVHKALAKNPDERYQSTLELAHALRLAFSQAGTATSQDRRAFVARPPLGDVTQKIYTSEIPTMQQPLAGPAPAVNLDVRTSLLNQGAKARNTASDVNMSEGRSPIVRPASVVPQSGSLSPSSGGERRLKSKKMLWLRVLLLFGLCAVLFTGALLFSPSLQQWLHLSQPFLSLSTPTPIPGKEVGATAVPTQSPVQQAQQVIRSYYAAINEQRYQDAYNLWGHAYQSSQPFDQFAKGFSTTQHDTIVIQGSKQLADGTVQVAVILYATNKQNAGSVINTYQGNYTVGQEDGTWKLLDSSLAPVNVPSPTVPAA